MGDGGALGGAPGGALGAKVPNSILHEHEEQQQQQSRFLDLVKTWLLCGWVTNKKLFKPGYVEVQQSRGMSSSYDPYVRPSRWTLFVRRCRARWKKSPGCWEAQHGDGRNPLHYYKTESYERNFDRGREYWEDLPIVGNPVEDESEWGIPVSPSVPDPVWMITASQEDMKQKAAAIAKARRGEA